MKEYQEHLDLLITLFIFAFFLSIFGYILYTFRHKKIMNMLKKQESTLNDQRKQIDFLTTEMLKTLNEERSRMLVLQMENIKLLDELQKLKKSN